MNRGTEQASTKPNKLYERALTQEKIDKIADVIWWIQGAMFVDNGDIPFDNSHVRALADARVLALAVNE